MFSSEPLKLTLDFVEGCLDSGRVEALNEVAYVLLARKCRMWSGDREHLAGYWESLAGGGSKFWEAVRLRAATDSDLEGYLVKCFKRYVSRHAPVGKGEPAWLKRRVGDLLKKESLGGDFVRGEVQKKSWYGLRAWNKSFEDLGKYTGFLDEWNIAEKAQKFPQFERQKVGQRSGPYRDEDLLEGCRRLLEWVKRFTKAYVLGRGIITHWAPCVDLGRTIFTDPKEGERRDSAEEDPDERNQEETADLTVHELQRKEIADLAADILKQLEEHERQAFLEYTVPKIRGQKVTYGQVAEKAGTSGQTIKNWEASAFAKMRRHLECLSMEDRIGIQSFFMQASFEKMI